MKTMNVNGQNGVATSAKEMFKNKFEDLMYVDQTSFTMDEIGSWTSEQKEGLLNKVRRMHMRNCSAKEFVYNNIKFKFNWGVAISTGNRIFQIYATIKTNGRYDYGSIIALRKFPNYYGISEVFNTLMCNMVADMFEVADIANAEWDRGYCEGFNSPDSLDNDIESDASDELKKDMTIGEYYGYVLAKFDDNEEEDDFINYNILNDMEYFMGEEFTDEYDTLSNINEDYQYITMWEKDDDFIVAPNDSKWHTFAPDTSMKEVYDEIYDYVYEEAKEYFENNLFNTIEDYFGDKGYDELVDDCEVEEGEDVTYDMDYYLEDCARYVLKTMDNEGYYALCINDRGEVVDYIVDNLFNDFKNKLLDTMGLILDEKFGEGAYVYDKENNMFVVNNN